MKKLAIVALLLSGCAVPVRPIAKLVPDVNGGAHFEADPEREPHVPPAVFTGVAGLLNACGPWGQLAALLVPTAAAFAAGHKKGKGPKKNKTVDPA